MRRGQQVSEIAGCRILDHRSHRDKRGTFLKVLSAANIEPTTEEFSARELFWSKSVRGVLRGMHIQTPPHATTKLVWVSNGAIRDVVLDLRIDSDTFGSCLVTELDEERGGLLVPRGCAHGFEVLSDSAIINYAQDKDHAPTHDTGVAWNSFGFEWITKNPILSDRDRALPPMSEFRSPFTMSDSM
jgi:dTDP-4-dehydrorhamnose 3,5-epimerase